MEERITKLFILAGDQGAEHDARDFIKVNQIIVGQYLSKNDQQITNTIITKFTSVIARIPLKYHLYAGLTAKISLFNKQISNQIIQITINNLQKSLGDFQFYNSLNLIAYLSELMNISLLNSLTFMNILEDILDKIQSVNNPNTKRFYINVLVRSLPACIHSLSEKLPQDLKNFMDLLGNHAQNQELLVYIKKLINKGKNINFSLMNRLNQNFTGLQQYHAKIKLRIEIIQQKQAQWSPVEYFNLNSTLEDELYNQFIQQQGRIHQLTVQHLIQTFYSRSGILYMKLQNYINHVPSHTISYVYQLTISTLISKSLRSQCPVIQQSLIISLINNFEQKIVQQSVNITKNELNKMVQNQLVELFQKGENLDFSSLINVSNLISFVINGLKYDWDWEKFLQNENIFAKRRVLLILILEKTKLLNDYMVLPECFSQYPHYQAPTKLTNQMQYKTAQQMQTFQNFQTQLKSKSPSQTINQMIKNQRQYQIFLQALFRRTSLSQTHLKTLIQRYNKVLIANHEYDWALINKIRNFWKNSYVNRQAYLQLMIRKQFVTFNSYVNYVGQLKDKNQREMIWIKVELNQLNNIFGNSSFKKSQIKR